MALARRVPTENDLIQLLAEVQLCCPVCAQTLLYEKKHSLQKGFEIAHIYPLNPTHEETALLAREERLSSDVNSNDNLIPLCPNCHTRFDKPRTVEEYRTLVEAKKLAAGRRKELAHQSGFDVPEALRELVAKLLSVDEAAIAAAQGQAQTATLSYDPKRINEKLDNTVDIATKLRIKDDVRQYFFLIRKLFQELELSNVYSAEDVALQVRRYYIALAKSGKTKRQILTDITDWIIRRTDAPTSIAHMIAAFYIQNCEVYSDNP